MEDGLLFRRGINQALLGCISGDEVATMLKEVHSGDCGQHQRARGYPRKSCNLVIIGLLWSRRTVLCSKMSSIQLHADRIHALAVELDSSSTPWPFRTWAFDLLVVSIHLHENMYGFLLQQSVTPNGLRQSVQLL